MERRKRESVQGQDQEGRDYTLVFDLLWEGETQSYGLKITMERGQETTWVTYLDLTTNAQRAQDLFALVARNQVTPAGLFHVLEEWL